MENIKICVIGLGYVGLPLAEAALESFTNAAKYKNDFALSYYGQGLCLEKLNKKSDAIFVYEKFIELAPENPLVQEVKQKIDVLYEEIMK